MVQYRFLQTIYLNFIMKLTFLDRKFNPGEISIEKLFGFIKNNFSEKGVEFTNVENLYEQGLVDLFKGILFFRNKVKKNAIVHITGQIHFAAIALKTKKIVITVHDLGLYRDLPFHRFFIYKLFWIYLPFRRAKKLVAISQKSKDEIIKIMPSVKEKVIVIPNCVTVDISDTYVTDLKSIQNVLIVGTRSNKNTCRSLLALKGLPVIITIVGKLNQELSEILNNNKMEFKNLVNISDKELVKQYKNADILLFPSLYEGFGLPILEAQAQNTIVITSNILPLKEVAGGAAVLIDPLSVDSIKDGVNKALNYSKEEKLNLILKGKENLKNYSVEAVSNQYLEIYENL